MTLSVYKQADWTGRPRAPERSERVQRDTTTHAAVNVGNLERVASALLGGTLIALAWQRHGSGKALLSALGSGLLYRGVSGHCPLYTQLGADTARRPAQNGPLKALGSGSEETDLKRSVTIGRPAAELFRRWQEPDVQTRVMAHVAHVTPTADGRLRWHIGSRADDAASFETEVAELREGELCVWRSSADSALKVEWTLRLHKAPSNYGSEVTLGVRFEAANAPLPHKLSKLLGMPLRLVVERALRNFKALVECGEIPSAFHNPSARAGAMSNVEAPHALRNTH